MLKADDYIISKAKNFSTVLEMVEENCKKFSNKTVFQIKINNEYKKYTYKELGETVNSIAKALRRMLFLPGDRAGIYSENRPEWGMAYYGIMKSGGVVVPLDAQHGPAELEYILDHSKTKIIFTSKKCLDTVTEASRNIHCLKKIICFDDTVESSNIYTLKNILNKGAKIKFSLFHKVKPNHLMEILYTSGTTGIAKGVMLTQANVLSDITASCQMFDFNETDTFLSVLPLHHSFECTAGLSIPLYNGAAVTYAESLRSKNIIDNIKETNVTIMLGVPLLYEKLYTGLIKAVRERPLIVQIMFHLSRYAVRGFRHFFNKKNGKDVFNGLRKKAGLSSIRFFISGGGPLRHDIAEAFDDLGLTILQGYGLTETSPILTVGTLKYNNYYSVGLLLPGLDVKIDNPDSNGIGEIAVKGPVIMKGYYKNSKATREILKNHWLYTGDDGYQDKDGFLFITGRKKNIIVTPGGKNVFPEEIEEKLNESEYIFESMVYGVPLSEKNKGERVYAIIVPHYENITLHSQRTGLKYDTEEQIEHLIRHEVKKVNHKLAAYKNITGFKIHQEELVKTSTRKIKRYLYTDKLVKI